MRHVADLKKRAFLCPFKLRKELFTTAGIDNIDHNPSSNTARGSFHGTGISLFQNTSPGACGIERNKITTQHDKDLPSKTVRPLPDWYTDVPPCILKDEKAAVPVIEQPQRSDEQVLTKTLE